PPDAGASELRLQRKAEQTQAFCSSHPPYRHPFPIDRGTSESKAEADCVKLLALEPGDLPYEAVMAEGHAQAAVVEHAEHRGRGMGERSEFLPQQPEDEVLGRDGSARNGVGGWVAEDDDSSRV